MGYLSFYRLSTYHYPISGKYALFSPAGWASIWIIFSANLVAALQWNAWKLLWLLLAGWLVILFLGWLYYQFVENKS